MLLVVCCRTHAVHLFVYGSASTPHLHSFPTRRSSDLAISLLDRAAFDGEQIASAAVEADVHFADEKDRAAKWTSASDRKSTRLNSSHRCISYAVFCLKKKKSTHAQTNVKAQSDQQRTH